MTDFLVDRYITRALDRCAIDVLKDWEYMEDRMGNTPAEARQAMERMTSLHGWSSGSPVQSSGNRREDMLIDNIDALMLAEQAQRDAERYFEVVYPVWKEMSAEEQFLLRERWITGGNGIQRIMDRLNVEKTKAYDLSNMALTKFRKKLFW